MTSKFALVIANTEYQDPKFAQLTAPGRDADEFAYILRDRDGANFDDVQVLINEEGNKVRRFIARFFSESNYDDLRLLYFSGHAVRNADGQLFLAVKDTERDLLGATGISAEFIASEMSNSRSNRQVLILDGCNTAAFKLESNSGIEVGKSMGTASAFVSKPSSEARNSINATSSMKSSGYGSIVLTATDSTHYAWEGDKVIGERQMSLFTYFLIQGLKGEADLNGDGDISVDELYDYAHEQIKGLTPKQTPSKFSSFQGGEIILRDNLKLHEVKPLPLPSDLLELLSHSNPDVRRLGIENLIKLLNGKNFRLTLAAQEKLREVADYDDSNRLREIASSALSAKGSNPPQTGPKLSLVPDSTQHRLKVFLCHSSGNKPVVRELYQLLNSEGWIDPWLDEVKLLPGQEWDLEIKKAATVSDVVIVCLSTSSVDKEGYIQKELRLVLNIAKEKPEGSIFLIPLRLDDCIVPERLRAWQWVDYFPKDQRQVAYRRLLESLKLRASKLGISDRKSV